MPQYCLDQSLLLSSWNFASNTEPQYSMYIIELCLANFSDLGNVCTKTLVSLTRLWRDPIHCGYFLMSSPEKDYDMWRSLQLMLRYNRLVSTKRLHKHAGILVKYCSYSNCVENIALSEFCKHTSKTGNLAYIKLKRFARLLHVSQRFEYVIRYQVLYNITYVATHLYLTNLYRT